jgi:hypothetical protein
MAQMPTIVSIIDVGSPTVALAVLHHRREPSQDHFSSWVKVGLSSIRSWDSMTKFVYSHMAVPMIMNKTPKATTTRTRFLLMKDFVFDILSETV